jgi:hypothetical protein
MNSFFDDLEAQLERAARAQIAAPDTVGGGRGSGRARETRGRRWVTTVARVVPVGVAVLAALAIAVLAVALLHHAHGANGVDSPASPPPNSQGPVQLLPTHPTRTQRQELNYVFDAQATVVRSDHACGSDRSLARLGDPGRRPSLSQAAPSAATLAILGVLRRPAVASDTLPPRLIGAPPHHHAYPNGTIPPVKDVYIRYVRKARHRFGANYYLVPAGNINLLAPVPARCWTEQDAALQREMPTISGRLRAGVLSFERRFVAQQRHNELPYPGVCLIAINNTGNGGGDCDAGGSLSQIKSGTGAMPSGAPTGVGVVFGIAPDGVHSVTFEYNRHHHRPVTVLAINNVFIVRREGLPNYGFPDTIVWKAADGHITKVIHRP